MMIVGLTGGIGSGKSTVAKLLEAQGVPVYNSDVEAKQLMATATELRKAIEQLLGTESYKDGILNREYIASRVFKDKELLHQLNAIVHPAVREHFIQWTQKQNHPYVVQETALLFENNAMSLYDKIILVTAPKDVKLKRILARDGSSEEQVLERMKNQLEDTEKLLMSHFVIENIDLVATTTKVKEINKTLLEYC